MKSYIPSVVTQTQHVQLKENYIQQKLYEVASNIGGIFGQNAPF